MTEKKSADDKPKVDLRNEINRLMSPAAAKELQGLSPTFQQFLIRWTDLRDSAMMEEVKLFIQDLYEKDNEAICKNVADIVRKELVEELAPFHTRLGSIESSQKEIKEILDSMNKRMDITEKQLFETDEKRLIDLERYASIGNTILRGLGYIVTAVILSVLAFFTFHHRMK